MVMMEMCEKLVGGVRFFFRLLIVKFFIIGFIIFILFILLMMVWVFFSDREC